MFSGVTGLRSHQTMVDNIGNNIANVNTFGYKSSTVVFQDLLSEVISGAGLPTTQAGGTNPAQVGLGVKVGGIATSFTQGAAQLTGRATDLSIQGDGFLMVRNATNETLFTRSGALDFDAMGRLVSPSGAVLQGWTANSSGVLNTNVAVGDIIMPLGQQLQPEPTGSVTFGGNLDAAAAAGTTVSTSIKVYDQQGTGYDLSVQFTKSATADEWTLAGTADLDGNGTQDPVTISGGPLTFDPTTGQVNSGAITIDMGKATFPSVLTLDTGAPGEPDAMVQFAGSSSAAALLQDGNELGSLQSFTIGPDGVVTGVFSNGRNRPLAQLALATFTNPGGLIKAGDSSFSATVNSGNAQIGAPGGGGRGSILSATLEMSNVDLAREFTNLIIAQRGYQANSRVITSSDELLQELVNLKR